MYAVVTTESVLRMPLVAGRTGGSVVSVGSQKTDRRPRAAGGEEGIAHVASADFCDRVAGEVVGTLAAPTGRVADLVQSAIAVVVARALASFLRRRHVRTCLLLDLAS